MDGREIILEFHHVGNTMRVAAVDTETAIEIVFQAPIGSPTDAIVALARRKLAARLNRCRDLASGPQFL